MPSQFFPHGLHVVGYYQMFMRNNTEYTASACTLWLYCVPQVRFVLRTQPSPPAKNIQSPGCAQPACASSPAHLPCTAAALSPLLPSPWSPSTSSAGLWPLLGLKTLPPSEHCTPSCLQTAGPHSSGTWKPHATVLNKSLSEGTALLTRLFAIKKRYLYWDLGTVSEMFSSQETALP